MAVVTISREFGSLGTSIGHKVAQSLKYEYVDKKLIEKVLLEYGMVAFEGVYNSTHNIWDISSSYYKATKIDEIINMFSKTMRAFANINNIVLAGRAGFVLLNGYKDVLNVLVRAPFEVRVARTMKSMDMKDYEEASNYVIQQDHQRHNFIHTFYKANPNEANWFNLAIDTGTVSEECATNWIIEAAENIDKRHFDQEDSIKSIQVDNILKDAVLKAFRPD